MTLFKNNPFIGFLMLLWIFATGCRTNGSLKTIVDAHGNEIAIPREINAIADSWPAHNMIVYMLGKGDKIVATSISEAMCPWFYKINPSMKKAVTAFARTGTGNIEEVIKAKPDIIFFTAGSPHATTMRNFGVPVVELSLSDFPSLRECVLTTGEILGGDAIERAEAYAQYLDEKVSWIANTLADIPASDRPTVMHISSLEPLVVNGKNTMMDAWITLSGGINAIQENLQGQSISMESLLGLNPDIIVFSPTGKNITEDDILKNPVLKNTKAVKNKRVYLNPKGLFFWDRYSAEEALQIQWAAQKFYPWKFEELDIVNETVYFFQTFFKYPLTREEAVMIIQGIPPRDEISNEE
ncbi:MAG: ABC transporter substrate-binding protein [Tannerellaceae bacterium]|nr:ABC transporter substrate-binding protein [Tannerellaceae bacterium]